MAILILAPFLIASILNYAFMYLNSANAVFVLGIWLFILKALALAVAGFFLAFIYKIADKHDAGAILAASVIALAAMILFSIYELVFSPFWPSYISLGFFWYHEPILPFFAGGYLFIAICSVYKLHTVKKSEKE